MKMTCIIPNCNEEGMKTALLASELHDYYTSLFSTSLAMLNVMSQQNVSKSDTVMKSYRSLLGEINRTFAGLIQCSTLEWPNAGTMLRIIGNNDEKSLWSSRHSRCTLSGNSIPSR